MYKKAVSVICALIAASLAIELNKYFIFLKINNVLSLFISISISTILQIFLDYLLSELPFTFSWFRHFIDPSTTIEGYWYEKITDSRNPHSYVCIEYDYQKQEYILYGINYDNSFKTYATFRSNNVRKSKNGNIVYYDIDAQIFNEEAKKVLGYGRLVFYKDGARSFVRGEGHFIDIGNRTKLQERYFLLYKIDKSLIKETLGKSHIQTDYDIQKLIKKIVSNNLNLNK
ncbi:MAG: hypothetical protein VKN72_27535 [Nostocales cyanobacterium 94392]|nr:hypothetical protein [Nostocales cyanobacterium 94392]